MASMFDIIHSSFDFGDGRTNVIYGTTDLGCALLYLWISPGGQLYKRDTSTCYKRTEIYPGNKAYDHKFPWRNVHWEPTGDRGKMTPSNLSARLNLYEMVNDSPDHSTAVMCHFEKGLLVGFTKA